MGSTHLPPTFDPREEPGALAAHAGICAGALSNERPYRGHLGLFIGAQVDAGGLLKEPGGDPRSNFRNPIVQCVGCVQARSRSTAILSTRA